MRQHRPQRREQVVDDGIVQAGAALIAEFAGGASAVELRDLCEGPLREIEHQRVEGVANVSDGIAAQIVDRRRPCEKILRTSEFSVEVEIVIGALSQLQADEVGVFAGDAGGAPEVRLVAAELGDGHGGFVQSARDECRRIGLTEGVTESIARVR